METKKFYLGIEFRSDEADLNKMRIGDLFAIAFNKLNPNGGELPTNKEISHLIMNKEIKVVEIIINRSNKYMFDARFYY